MVLQDGTRYVVYDAAAIPGMVATFRSISYPARTT
jgi:hypothetical protein